jgi:murein DD-endopeptidase MepM/ murein hydrolase activator NlpD
MCFKKKEDNPVVVEPPSIHHDFVPPVVVNPDVEALKAFYADNDIPNLAYRKGAAFTGDFGLTEGWGANFTPGYVRIHTGVDRAHGGTVAYNNTTVNDIVICPFNFDTSDFLIFGPTESYGSMVILISKKYGFDFRIAHMNPDKDIIPWSLQQFKSHQLFKQGWLIGSAGTYGYSTGAHTHTEMISLGEHCDIFEQLLKQQYGEEANKEYTDDDILDGYRKQAAANPKTSPYVSWSDDQIRADWVNQKKARNAMFINKYKSIFYWSAGEYHTRYASNLLFSGL